jgi:hypothetical protein
VRWWRQVLEAIGLAADRPAPQALPPAAKEEIDRWAGTDLSGYEGGIAPPDAPPIDDDGTI